MVLRVIAIRTGFLLVVEGGCPEVWMKRTTALNEGIEDWRSA